MTQYYRQVFALSTVEPPSLMASLGVLSYQLYRSKKGPKSFFSLYFASAADKRVTLSIKLRRDDDKFKINLLESQSCPSLVDPRP